MIELKIKEMIPQEQMYSYTQSMQIMSQTGCIGHLRADMDSNGKGFFSSWDDHRADLKTQDFKDEFDEVINALRFDPAYGDILKDRSSLSKYCYSHPESSFGNDREYGIRLDTEGYAYLMRLNPNKGEYNLYCYCYKRDWLDRHMDEAKRGIRFIDPHYKELFRIPDGDRVRIIDKNGEHRDRTARYIDQYHVELCGGLGSSLYHICELAERLEAAESAIIPLRSSLPELCFNVLPSTGELIKVNRGENGYYPCYDRNTNDPKANREYADDRNIKLGVSKAQEQAMLAGSMFGWHAPAADPKNYDDAGRPVRSKHRERGDAR